MVDVSIILPCLNEAELLEESVCEIQKVMDTTHYSYEIIISEDGSTDGTDKIAERLSKEDKQIMHLHSNQRLGRGRGVEKGIHAAHGDVVGFIDADLQTPATDIPRVVDEVFQGHDFVTIRRRYHNKGFGYYVRVIPSVGFMILTKVSFWNPVYDTAAGCKFFKKEKILPVLSHIKDNHWFWDTEICVLSHRLGLSMKEIPSTFYKIEFDERQSKVKILETTIDYLIKLVKLRFRLWFSEV